MAREALDDVACGVPPDSAYELRLLVSELVTNAVEHAGLRRGETIDLDVRTTPERAQAVVRYPEHVAFAPSRVPEPEEPSAEGLVLVDRIADRWSVVGDGEQVLAWFEVDLPRHDAA